MSREGRLVKGREAPVFNTETKEICMYWVPKKSDNHN